MWYSRIQEARSFIRSQTRFKPRFGIILGTGLGGLAQDIDVEQTITYNDIPHFPEPTVQSHQGQLIFGYLSAQPVVAMAGRFHYYEGYSMQQVTFPVRVMKALGMEQLIISNVSGSTHPDVDAGDIVFIKDHINLHPKNPLRGENIDELGPRFPDMSNTYDRTLNQMALAIAHEHMIPAHEGVYVGLPGPSLETPSEYQLIHYIGGDVVGMSTVPEVIVASHMGIPVFVLSVVSNKCYPIDSIVPTTLESVLALANMAAPRMRFIVKTLLQKL